MENSVLQQSQALFVRRWGEMAASWGISRTMAEIHALLFVSLQPLCTDDLMEQLQVSRGNVSTNLRQLVTWGLIQRVHQRGDRKEYFVAETDVWEMFEIITRERRRREIEPIIETIDKCSEMILPTLTSADGPERDEIVLYQQRLDEMREFLNLVNSLFNLLIKVGKPRVAVLMKTLTNFGLATRE